MLVYGGGGVCAFLQLSMPNEPCVVAFPGKFKKLSKNLVDNLHLSSENSIEHLLQFLFYNKLVSQNKYC
jgi:hypothetical protein